MNVRTRALSMLHSSRRHQAEVRQCLGRAECRRDAGLTHNIVSADSTMSVLKSVLDTDGKCSVHQSINQSLNQPTTISQSLINR